MTAEPDQICDVCGEHRNAHLATVAGPLTCRREAIGQGHYRQVGDRFKFETSPIPKLYPDMFGLDDDGLELELDIREMTIAGPLLPDRKPAPPARRPTPPRIPYHVRYPPVVDAPVTITLEPSVVYALLDCLDTDTIVCDPPLPPTQGQRK